MVPRGFELSCISSKMYPFSLSTISSASTQLGRDTLSFWTIDADLSFSGQLQGFEPIYDTITAFASI